MTSVISFPTGARSQGFRPGMALGASAQIVILPVVRIERHVENVAEQPAKIAPKAPRRPRDPVFSGDRCVR